MIKRAICLLLSLCLMMSGFCFSVVSASTGENLALASNGATAEGFETNKDYPAINAIDGNKTSSGWQSYSSTSKSGRYLQIKLAELASINEISFINTTSSNSWEIYYSLTGEDGSWIKATGLTTVSSSSPYEHKVTLSSVVAQYVKVLRTASGKNIFIREIEIYGEFINPYLSSIKADGELLQEFDKSVTSYDIEVESADDLPVITAYAEDTNLPLENVVITQATPETMKATIEVKIGDYVHTYTVNMLSLEGCAELKEITVDGAVLKNFDRKIKEYTVYLNEGESIPEIVAQPLVEGATVGDVITDTDALNVKIPVTSADGNATEEYTLQFVHTSDKLKSLIVEGFVLTPVFSKDVTVYTVYLPSLSSIPQIEAEAKYDNAEVEITQGTSSSKTAKVVVTSKLGSTSEYVIYFEEENPYGKLSATATANGALKDYPAINAVDGDYGTRWYYEKKNTVDGQLVLELESLSVVGSVALYENWSNTDVNFENIEVSTDGLIWTKPEKTLTKYSDRKLGTLSTLGRKRVYDFIDTVAAKYVRFTWPTRATNDHILLAEMEVYGKEINPYLRGIEVGGELLQGFDKNITSYDVMVSTETELPTVTATAEDTSLPLENVVITQATPQTMQARIDVTTAGGEYTNSYFINMIAESKNTQLSALSISQGTLSPAFDREITSYSVYVEDITALPTVTATALALNADVSITQANSENLTASVVVVSQDESDSRTYTVEFVPTGYLLRTLSVEGYELNRSFDPEWRSYRIEMESLNDFPKVTAQAMYDNTEVSIVQATASTKQAKVTVTSKLGNSKTYNISFIKAVTEKNLSLTATAKSNKAYTDTPADKAIDGDMLTRWNSSNGNTDDSPKAKIEIELSDPSEINSITIWEFYSSNNSWFENIEYSLNGKDWSLINASTVVYGDLQMEGTSQTGRERVYNLSQSVQARYVRLVAPKGGHIHITEFEIYGTPLTDSYLQSVQLSCGNLGKAFDKKINTYDIFVESKNELPVITPIVQTEGAFTEVTDATAQTMQATVKVTDPERKFTNTYTFNMIERYANTQLSTLIIDKGELLPQFSRDVTQYTVYVEPDKKMPVVTAAALSSDATVHISQATAEDTTAVITVTSGDEETATQYKVEFITTGTDLETLTAGTKELFPAFDAQCYTYSVVLEVGEPLPTVNATEKYAVSKKTVTHPTEATMKATVVLKSYLNLESTYTINFLRKKNDTSSAKLTYIKLSRGCINGLFSTDKKEYTAYVTDRQNLPIIYPVTEDGGATYTVTDADAKTMTAKINVTSADGTQTEEYTLYFLVNATLGKSAWTSSQYNGTEGPKAIDGKFDTYWNASSGATPEWIVCNLEGTSKIFEVVVHTRYSSKSEYYDIIQASDDGRNWRTISSTCKMESYPGKYGYPEYYKFSMSFEPFDAKYVRVTGNGAGRVTILELELWGIPEPTVSANSYLKNLEFSGGILTPSFSPYITNYTIALGKDEPVPTITAYETVNEFATVTPLDATASTMQAIITVTAENGVSKTIYTVNIDKEVDAEKNTYLSSLIISDGEITPAFSPNNSSYTVYLAPEAQIPEITAIPAVQGANAVKNTEGNTVHITVTSKDTTATRIYTLNFVHANADLSAISVQGATLTPALTPGIYNYTAEMAAGATLPTVDATAAGDASVIITQPDIKTNKAIIVVKANGSEYSKKYTISFTFRQSLEDAMAAALDAVRVYSATNATEEGDIMALVKGAVTNPDISITWKNAFSKNAATTENNGLVSGTLTFTLSGVSADIQIRKTISKLSGGLPSGDGGSGGGGGGGGGSSNVSFGTPTIDNDAVLDTAKQENTTDKYKEVRGHWAEKEVIVLSEKGIVKGNGTSFALEYTVTRAEFITMLVRACEIEILPYNNAFSDVKNSDWFAQYIEAAVKAGIAGGYDGRFNPQGTATREEAVKMLVGAYEMHSGEIEHEDDADFTDGDTISEWAVQYVQKAVAKKFVKGFETGEFMPRATLTRAQAMTLIYRLTLKNENAEEMR